MEGKWFTLLHNDRNYSVYLLVEQGKIILPESCKKGRNILNYTIDYGTLNVTQGFHPYYTLSAAEVAQLLNAPLAVKA